MTNLDEQGRPEPPLAADENATLLGFLDYERATLAWKCAGPGAGGLQVMVAASSMTLGGILKHLTYVEDLWFSRILPGRDPEPPWDTVNWDADHDWDWHSAAGDTPSRAISSGVCRSAPATAVIASEVIPEVGHLAASALRERSQRGPERRDDTPDRYFVHDAD
jgi:hypothetical protein